MTRIQLKMRPGSDRLSAGPYALPVGCDKCSLIGSTLCRVVQDEAPTNRKKIETHHYHKGEILVSRHETPGFIGVLRNGYLRNERQRPNGNRILLELALPGDVVGGVPGIATNCISEAATDIEICTFDRAAVEHLMLESPRFRHVFLRETGRQHQRLLGSAWRRNALDSRERIIAFLVDATAIMPTETQPDKSLIVQIEISRRDWADLTNTAVETISRTMRYLAEKDMVISLTPYTFRIRDLDGLAALAGIDPPMRPGL